MSVLQEVDFDGMVDLIAKSFGTTSVAIRLYRKTGAEWIFHEVKVVELRDPEGHKGNISQVISKLLYDTMEPMIESHVNASNAGNVRRRPGAGIIVQRNIKFETRYQLTRHEVGLLEIVLDKSRFGFLLKIECVPA